MINTQVRAFKYNSVDCLLKPINGQELQNAIIKFEKRQEGSVLDSQDKNVINNLLKSLKSEGKERFIYKS